MKYRVASSIPTVLPISWPKMKNFFIGLTKVISSEPQTLMFAFIKASFDIVNPFILTLRKNAISFLITSLALAGRDEDVKMTEGFARITPEVSCSSSVIIGQKVA